VFFHNTKENWVISGIANATGNLELVLPAGIYTVRLKTMNGNKDYTEIEIPTLGPNEFYNNINIIIQFEEDKSFTLTDLYFETGKSIIKPESYSKLNELVAYLKLNSALKIQISGHTDNQGEEEANLTLSKNRANAVRDYLVKNGIQTSRIITVGMGETKPIASNDNESGRAFNRRIEIQIL
jgi:outer membrane protein OmpA-like peptidoglycan-associated protein